MEKEMTDDGMIIRRVEAEEFGRVFPKGCTHLFNSMEFAQLNAAKCDAVHYLLCGDGRKWRMGMILGERGERLLSPFSAPFGGFTYNKDQTVEVVEACAALVADYGRGLGKSVEIFLPPGFYDEAMLVKVECALVRRGRLMYADLNYHYDLRGITEANWQEVTASRMNQKARRKMRDAMAMEATVELLDRARRADVERMYAVIAANRAWKGYPLRMTLDDVARTVALAEAEMIVMTLGGRDVAAALVYRVAQGVMQVVYWGNVPGCDGMNVMHRFAPEVFRICAGMGAKILDIGPSSEGGVPSEGLCFFKESIGCTPRLKPRIVIN